MAATEMCSSSSGKTKRLNLTLEKPETSRKRPCSRPCLFTTSTAKARSATPGSKGYSSKWPESHSEEHPNRAPDSQRPSGVIRVPSRGSQLSRGICISPQIPHHVVYDVLDSSYHFELFLDNRKSDLRFHRSEPVQGVNAVHLEVYEQVGFRIYLFRRNFKLLS